MSSPDLKNYRAPQNYDSDWGVFLITLIALVAALMLSGCAAPGFDYAWTQARPASVKPYIYITVADPDAFCRSVGVSTLYLGRIAACATWKPENCVIYLPPNSPDWIKSHEEKHCEGFSHP